MTKKSPFPTRALLLSMLLLVAFGSAGQAEVQVPDWVVYKENPDEH